MNDGDYWPEGGRYGVMCTSGYPDSAGSFSRNARQGARLSFSFWVCDTADRGLEVNMFKGRGDTLDDPFVRRARRFAMAEADRLNARDKDFDAAA